MLKLAITKKSIANCFLIIFASCSFFSVLQGADSTNKQYKADLRKNLFPQQTNCCLAEFPLFITPENIKQRGIEQASIRMLCAIPKSKRNFVKINGDGGVDVTGAPKQQLVEGANLVLFLQHYFGGSNLYLYKKINTRISGSVSQLQKTKASYNLGANDYVSLTDVIFPKHLDGVESPILSGGSTHPDFTGYPFIDMDGNPNTVEDQIVITERYFDWKIQWKDTEIAKHKNVRTIKRRWIIKDTKAGNTSVNTQIIKQYDNSY